jgi:DNA (cytosine-5)-methyltransferase 1
LNYLSVCSGIEAATVAWHDLGWNPVGFSEIEKFPSQVLAHHYPQVPNFGDMTKYKEWNINDPVGLLVGGTPCQSFSVAGLRKGLEDPRGNLALTYVGILDHFRPKWCVWENVPGVLSSNDGRDFGSFLGALVELGYGFSYRVLDAQNFGVAQRRRRVFVVGHLGDWQPAAKVLFESESLSGNTKSSRKEGQETARGFVPSVANTLQTTCNDYIRADGFNMIAYENHPSDSRVKEMGKVCTTVTSKWGTGGGNVPLVQLIPYDLAQVTSKQNSQYARKHNDKCHTLAKGNAEHTAIAYSIQGNLIGRDKGGPQGIGVSESGAMYTLTKADVHGVYANMAVRRLTPVECERLQGFPDNYTNIPKAADGNRYKALGNSMAVPVMRWIGERIDRYEQRGMA